MPNRIWQETPIQCECLGLMVTDGQSLPVCPDCGKQMTLSDVLAWLMVPKHPQMPVPVDEPCSLEMIL